MQRRLPSQRLSGAAALVPLLGAFLLLPPFVSLFTGSARPFGLPLIVVYLFLVWGALVVAAWYCARHLVDPPANTGAVAEAADSLPTAPPG